MSVPAPSRESSLARWIRLAAFAATSLLILFIARWVMLAPSVPRIAIGVILALPFAFGMPLLYVGHRRTYVWLTLALAPALVLGLTEAVANPAIRLWSTLFLLDLLAAFALMIAYLRQSRSD